MHYEHTYNALYVVMAMVIVKVAYNYNYTALKAYYKAYNYVHNASEMDALSKVFPNLK